MELRSGIHFLRMSLTGLKGIPPNIFTGNAGKPQNNNVNIPLFRLCIIPIVPSIGGVFLKKLISTILAIAILLSVILVSGCTSSTTAAAPVVSLQIERLLNTKVYLELFVKVRPGWRDSRQFVQETDWRTQLEQLSEAEVDADADSDLEE